VRGPSVGARWGGLHVIGNCAKQGRGLARTGILAS